MTTPRRHLDWMCIRLDKIEEDGQVALYRFAAAVYEPDPDTKGRNKRVGENIGVLSICKSSGEVSVVDAMPEDDQGKVSMRAAVALKKQWQKGVLPPLTSYQCG